MQLSEGRILQALREEVAATEARLDEERAAHAGTRRAFAAREQELEGSLGEAGTALTGLQRKAEEERRRAFELQASGPTPTSFKIYKTI